MEQIVAVLKQVEVGVPVGRVAHPPQSSILLTPRHDWEDTTAAPRTAAASEMVLRVPCPRFLGAGLFGPPAPAMPKALKR